MIDYDFDSYQAEAVSFCSEHNTMTINGLGIAGEAGECADLVKKIVGHGVTEYKDKPVLDALVDELGDVLWYIAAMCNTIGVDMDTVAHRNIRKLRERYPNGFVPGGGNR